MRKGDEPKSVPRSQYIPMSDKEVWDFLDAQKILFVATVSRDCKPHNTPVWFVVHQGNLYFRSQGYKVKVKNIRNTQRVSCSAHDGSKYTELRGITMEARATIVRDNALIELVNNMLMEKYKEERNYHQMPPVWRKRWELEKRRVVEITPLKIASWDNNKWLQQF